MSNTQVRFAFDDSVVPKEAEGTLRLAVMAVESLFGSGRVALECRYRLDRRRRIALIDTTGEVGRTLALIFRGYVRREFGDDAVQMTRVTDPTPPQVGSNI
jgi:hypothetical protein